MPYALRNSYASWSLAAGVNVFTLARRMGTSVEMIDRTYGHLVRDADALESRMLDEWDGSVSPLSVRHIAEGREMWRDAGKPSIGLEPMTPSLPWKCSTN